MREFIPSGKFKNEEILSALQWYFESKNIHLEAALKIITPMTTEDVKRLRMNYSHYFTSLISALEMLRDRNYSRHKAFREQLMKEFIFGGHDNGEENYNYLKELRNCIVHRGYDITCAAHTPCGHPLLLAPEKISAMNGKSEYSTFGKYILELVSKVESVVGNIVYSHVESVELLKPTYAVDEQLSFIKEFVSRTNVMPEPFKKMAQELLSNVGFESMNKERFSRFEEIIKANVLIGVV